MPIGASFWLSPILLIMAFRTCREDEKISRRHCLHLKNPKEKRKYKTFRKKDKWRTKRQKTQRLPTNTILSIRAQLLPKKRRFDRNGCYITFGGDNVKVYLPLCFQVLVRLDDGLSVDRRLRRSSSRSWKGWMVRLAKHEYVEVR